ncbi:retropepsin-like aspartic protease [Metallibacterium sp.]|uniref:retropepsin-like aspartic protease n=1 Tax=Metallibacterium sp. TaxID=2940281 RepID=UPI00260B8C36|nr:retropepsin-like aspartic protease [Metallibacterium sp.]
MKFKRIILISLGTLVLGCANAATHGKVPAGSHAGDIIAYRSSMGITGKIESARLRELTKFPTDAYARFGMLLINGKFKRLEDATTLQCLDNSKIKTEDLSLYLMCLEMKASAELTTDNFPRLASSILQMNGVVTQVNIAYHYGAAGTYETSWISNPGAIKESPSPTFLNSHKFGIVPLNAKCQQQDHNYYSVVAKVNGIRTCFTLDTGSNISTLGYMTARRLHIRPTNTKFNGITQSTVKLALVKRLTLAHYTARNFYFGVFPKQLAGNNNNLLGMNFLVHLRSVLLTHGDIYINGNKPQGCVPVFLRFAYTGRFLGPAIIFKARINGHAARLLFDSGLSNNMVVFSPDKFDLRLHPTTQTLVGQTNDTREAVRGYSVIKLDFDKGPQIFLPALITSNSAFGEDPGIDINGAFSLETGTLIGMKVFLDFNSGFACIINPSNPRSNPAARVILRH